MGATFRHPVLPQTFDLIILIVNWLLTIMVLFVSGVALLKQHTIPDGLLLFPITVILTIPSLQAIMIGLPNFGAFVVVFSVLLTSLVGVLLGKDTCFQFHPPPDSNISGQCRGSGPLPPDDHAAYLDILRFHQRQSNLMLYMWFSLVQSFGHPLRV